MIDVEPGHLAVLLHGLTFFKRSQQVRPLVELGQDDDQGTFVPGVVGEPLELANPRRGLVQDRFLTAQPVVAARRSVRVPPAVASRAKPLVLGRVEEEQDGPRVSQVMGHRAGRGVLTWLKMFPRVVVKAKHARELGRSSSTGMPGLRLDHEQEGTRVADELLAECHRVVQLTLELGLANQAAQRQDLRVAWVEKQRFLALVEHAVGALDRRR